MVEHEPGEIEGLIEGLELELEEINEEINGEMDHHQQLKLELEQTAQRLERVKDKRRYREKKLAKLKEKLADAGITTDE